LRIIILLSTFICLLILKSKIEKKIKKKIKIMILKKKLLEIGKFVIFLKFLLLLENKKKN